MLNKSYLQAVRIKLRRQGKSDEEIESEVDKIVGEDQEEVDQPVPEDNDELSTGDLD